MKNVMLTSLEQKWWFAGIRAGLSALVTLPLLQAAGLSSAGDWAQWLVHFLCFYTVWSAIGFLGWFVIMLAAPSSKLLDPAKR